VLGKVCSVGAFGGPIGWGACGLTGVAILARHAGLMEPAVHETSRLITSFLETQGSYHDDAVVVGGAFGLLARTAVDRRVIKGQFPAKTYVTPSKQSVPGGAVRQDSIPAGSRLEYLSPGRVRFDGVEFRAVRDLSHLSEGELGRMVRKGINPKDASGIRLDGHHYQQQYHREPGAFIVEIPDPQHCISNRVQHPLGTSGGLTAIEREDWNKLRIAFNKERAKTELLRRQADAK